MGIKELTETSIVKKPLVEQNGDIGEENPVPIVQKEADVSQTTSWLGNMPHV